MLGATWRPLPARAAPEVCPLQVTARPQHLQRGSTHVVHARGMDTDNQIFIHKHRQWSIWYADPGPIYKKYIMQDYFIRKQAHSRLQNGGVIHVEITRRPIDLDIVDVVVYATKPNEAAVNLQKFQQVISERFNIRASAYLKQADLREAAVIANVLARKLEEDKTRSARALQQAVQYITKTCGIQNYKVRIGGRLDGTELAEHKIVNGGSLPFSTWLCHVEYCKTTAHTKFGCVGVKVWIYRNKDKPKSGLPPPPPTRREVLAAAGLPQLDEAAPKKLSLLSNKVVPNYDPTFEYEDDLTLIQRLRSLQEDRARRAAKRTWIKQKPNAWKRLPKGQYKYMMKKIAVRKRRSLRKVRHQVASRRGVKWYHVQDPHHIHKYCPPGYYKRGRTTRENTEMQLATMREIEAEEAAAGEPSVTEEPSAEE